MSNKQDNRATQILQMLSAQEKMDVAEIAERLGVSQVTARKDLDSLEERGFIRRVHGFAELNSGDELSRRLAYHYEEKKKIAEKAAALVRDGDTVMIESGSCCAILADLLARRCHDLTILTNSAFIAEYIRAHKNVQVILLGGLYQQDSQCLVGPMIRDNAANYHVRRFFIGTDGWSERMGFTNKDPLRAQAVRDMLHSCDELVVLTESEKFFRAGTVPLNLRGCELRVITDARIPAEAVRGLHNQGVALDVVEN